MNHKFLLLIIIMIAAAGCSAEEPTVTIAPSPTPTCFDLSEDFMEAAESVFEKWDDAIALASNTSRGDLSGPIASLQEIKREAGDLDAPACSENVGESLVTLMESFIEGFLSFMADEEGPLEDMHFLIADAAQEYFIKSLAELTLNSMSDDIFLTYIATASSQRKIIKYRDVNGDFIEEKADMSWSKSFLVPADFQATIEKQGSFTGSACAIMINGQIAELIITETGVAIVCEASASSN